MQTLRAQVQNGRLVLDEPTDLPEGEVVYLQAVDAVLADDGMTSEEREDLFEALDEALDSVRPGESADAAESEEELPAPA